MGFNSAFKGLMSGSKFCVNVTISLTVTNDFSVRRDSFFWGGGALNFLSGATTVVQTHALSQGHIKERLTAGYISPELHLLKQLCSPSASVLGCNILTRGGRRIAQNSTLSN
jgi:hypothetical protein